MLVDTEDPAYPMTGGLANDLFVAVRSSLPQVARFLSASPAFGLALNQTRVAAEVVVGVDSDAPQKRFLVDEYYTRITWQDATHAEVQTNGAKGTIDWSGRADDMLRAELQIYPEGAPESVGMFLRLLASLLLPSRQGVLIHASGVVVQGQGIVFLGESGAGKTTTARRAGREGAMRVADDLAILRIDGDLRVRLEPCRFDRGGRLPGRREASWPLLFAYDIRKGAPQTMDLGRVDNPLATWCAAVLSSTGPPGALNSLLSLASTLSRTMAPKALHVSATGPILSTLTATISLR